MPHAVQGAAVSGAPVRPDLAAVTPIYYPIVEHRRFGSLAALCRRFKWDRAVVDEYIGLAAVNQSEVVLMDQVDFGDPARQMQAALMLRPSGGVVLCCALFSEASEDRADVEAVAREFAESKEFRGKLVAIGEFRPNPTAMPN